MSDLRVSDEERDRAAQEIREHYAAGRLDEDELSERLQRVYQARTEAELRQVRADLPVLAASERAALVRRRSELQRRLIQQTGSALTPFLFCTGIWLVSGASGPFWPIFLVLFAVIPLLRNGWRLYGPSPELDEVERELAQRSRGGRPRHRREHGRRMR